MRAGQTFELLGWTGLGLAAGAGVTALVMYLVGAPPTQVSFFFYTHGDFFEEIAKYRAGRRRWATIVRERYGAKTDKAAMFRFGCVDRKSVV